MASILNIRGYSITATIIVDGARKRVVWRSKQTRTDVDPSQFAEEDQTFLGVDLIIQSSETPPPVTPPQPPAPPVGKSLRKTKSERG